MKVYFSGKFDLENNKFIFCTDIVAAQRHMYDLRPLSLKDAAALSGMFESEDLSHGVLTEKAKKTVKEVVYTMLLKPVKLAQFEQLLGCSAEQVIGEKVTTDLSLDLALAVYKADKGSGLDFEFVEGDALSKVRIAWGKDTEPDASFIEEFLKNGCKPPIRVGDRVRIVSGWRALNGQKVEVLGTEDHYSIIKFADGVVGIIETDQLKVL